MADSPEEYVQLLETRRDEWAEGWKFAHPVIVMETGRLVPDVCDEGEPPVTPSSRR